MGYNVLEIDGKYYLRLGMHKIAVVEHLMAARQLAETLNEVATLKEEVEKIKRLLRG